MIDIERTVLMLNGKRYEIIPVENPIDVSKHNETEFPTQITHVIKGFEEDIHLIAEQTGEKEIGFSFGYFIGDTGLFVSVEDENVTEAAEELVFMAIGEDDD